MSSYVLKIKNCIKLKYRNRRAWYILLLSWRLKWLGVLYLNYFIKQIFRF